MGVDYIAPGLTLTHANWDDLFAQADAKLALALSNQCAVLQNVSSTGFSSTSDIRHKRRFYFFPPESPGTYWDRLGDLYYSTADIGGIFRRRYDHSVFTSLVSTLSVAANDTRIAADPDWPVVRLGVPDIAAFQATWRPLIWPDGAPLEATLDALLFSLECHKRVIGGREYNVYVDYSQMPEFIHKWNSVDIIIGDQFGAALTFPDNYNKYNFFRFNNVQTASQTVHFGTHFSLTIPPLQSRCVRRTAVNGVYTLGYKYFHKAMAGDPWFLNWISNSDALSYARDNACNNITDPDSAAAIIGQLYPHYDFTKLWDCKSIYNNAYHVGGKFERVTPSGGYFGEIANGTKLGDLAFHKGNLVVVNPAGDFRVNRTQRMTVDNGVAHTLTKSDGSIAPSVLSISVKRGATTIPAMSGSDVNWTATSVSSVYYITFTVRVSGSSPMLAAGDQVDVSFTHLTEDHRHPISFDGMATLSDRLAEANITLTLLSPPDQSFKLSSATRLDLYSLSTNLAAVFGPLGFSVGNGSNGASEVIFPSINLGLTSIYGSVFTSSVTATLRTAGYLDNGTPITVSWTNHDRSLSSRSIAELNLFDTVTNLIGAYTSGVGDVISVPSIQMTAFGPRVMCEQSLTLDYPVGLADYTDFSIVPASPNWKLSFNASNTLGGANFPHNFGWPAFGDSIFDSGPGGIRGAYPRFYRYWSNHRYYTVTPATTPFAYSGVTGSYTFEERPLVKSHYETKPFDDCKLLPVARSKANRKDGIAFVGPMDIHEYDVLTRFAAWVSLGSLSYKTPGGAVTTSYGRLSGAQASYYAAARASLLSNTPVSADIIGRNVAPIEVEQFNANASIINAATGHRDGAFESRLQARFLTQFNPEVTSGQGFGNLNIRPRDQWISWDKTASPDAEAWYSAHGFTVYKGVDIAPLVAFRDAVQSWRIANGSITDLDPYYIDPANAPRVPMVESGWGAYLLNITTKAAFTTALNNYRWIKISEAATVHANLGFPFVFEELCVPAKLKIADAAWTLLDTRTTPNPFILYAGGGGIFLSRAIGLVNADDGTLVFDSDASGAIRNNIDPTTYCHAYNVRWEPGSEIEELYDQNYGDLHQRFYDGDFMPVSPAQHIRANRYYLCRRYGGRQAKAITWPRNYADYQPRKWDSNLARYQTPSPHLPRIAVDNLESFSGGRWGVEVSPLLANENIITTGLQNGVLYIHKEPRPI